MFSHIAKTCNTVGRLYHVQFTRNIGRTISHIKETQKYDFTYERSRLDQLTVKYRSLSTANKILTSDNDLALDGNNFQEFLELHSDVIKDVMSSSSETSIADTVKWLSEVLSYNIPSGKKNRGTICVLSYKTLANPEDLTPENLRLAITLGWCLEVHQAILLMADDIMDRSETRRGQICWYKKEDVGLTAIYDLMTLEKTLYAILRKCFVDKPCYGDIIHAFQDILMVTTTGQYLDLSTVQCDKPKLDLFTREHYDTIATNKTAYYTAYSPVEVAMSFAGINTPENRAQVKDLLLHIGVCFQVRDDFIDCFGDPMETGKIGTDIQKGKCTWFAVAALERASPKQRKIIEECYGSEDPQKVAKIKKLYEDLDLRNVFTGYQRECLMTFKSQIQEISNERLQELLVQVVKRIFKKEVARWW